MEVLSGRRDIDEVHVGYKGGAVERLVRELEKAFDPGAEREPLVYLCNELEVRTTDLECSGPAESGEARVSYPFA